VFVEQTFRTDRGRVRRRQVAVDVEAVRAGLTAPGGDDRGDWQTIRHVLAGAVGEDQFAIWLEPLELVAVDRDGALLVVAPAALRGWVRDRFVGVLAHAAAAAGRPVRVADDAQTLAIMPAAGLSPADMGGAKARSTRRRRRRGGARAGASAKASDAEMARASVDRSAHVLGSPPADALDDEEQARASGCSVYSTSAHRGSCPSSYNPEKEVG
jgi:DnaA N-terminal domain